MLTEKQKDRLMKWDEDYSNMPDDYMYKLYLKPKRRVSYQKTFNMAARHMLKQGKKAYARGYRNMYETRDGLKGPIRVLISDRDWIPPTNVVGDETRPGYWIPSKMEFVSCDSGVVAEALLKIGHDLDLCKKIQRIHDKIEPENWKEELNKLAKEYNIEGVK